jgi:hypothetical protein
MFNDRICDGISGFGPSVMIAGKLGFCVQLRRKVDVCGWWCIDPHGSMILGIVDIWSQ